MDKIKEIYNKAKKENIPIMLDDGISFLLDFIQKNNIKRILEIGTAVGYSSIRMALLDKNITITTIERDNNRYLEAINNIKLCGLESRIKVIHKDALDVFIDNKFDLIFIDAAKGKNIDFFERFKSNLKINGYIITDNINFHGYVKKDLKDIESRNIRGLVRKIRKYIEFLNNNKEFETKFYELGDGISVSKRII